MAPVALCRKVTQENGFLHAQCDPRQGPGDLAGYKGLTADGRFVVKKDTVTGMDTVSFAVINGDPVGIQFSYPVR